MFNTDKPIETNSQDCLKRTNFSKQLAKAILNYTKQDNFVISLCGKWGSGKTSIINMVVEEMEKLTKNKEDKPIIIQFNPWNYTDSDQLISQFFSTLQNKLDNYQSNEYLKKISESLQNYSSAMNYTKYIPVIGEYLKPLKGIAEGLGKSIGEVYQNNENIEIQKNKIISALREQNQKFIIIIDDIDRLTNSQIRSIFQLVINIAGFPNMIYLLSFDREVVTRALEEVQNCDGNEYLEKIIQVPFNVPEASKQVINNILVDRVNGILEENNYAISEEDNSYCADVVNNSVLPFIDSVRDINRILNSFEFKYGFMKNEIHPIDLLAITTLQICVPDVYLWIEQNKKNLLKEVYGSHNRNSEIKKLKDDFFKQFESLYPKNPLLIIKAIKSLFPQFAKIVGEIYYASDLANELRKKNRIASRDRFDRYFNLSLEDIQISNEVINGTIYLYTKGELDKYFKLLVKKDIVQDYLRELYLYLSDIPFERTKVLIESFMKLLLSDFSNCTSHKYLSSPKSAIFNMIMELFINNEDKNENSEFIISLINNANKEEIGILCELVERIEIRFGRFKNTSKRNINLIDESDLESVELSILNMLEKFSSISNYLENENIISIYRVWELLNEEKLTDYIKKLLECSENVPKLLSLFLETYNSTNDYRWQFDNEGYNKYISRQEAYKKIIKLKGSTKFKMSDNRFKEVAVAFYLWCNKVDKEKNLEKRVFEEEVREEIKMW
ncbi:P-loop NTPase fold protein [Faecalibacillus faecis]|uniref:KAP family P-loop NTPase fold protein n=1 Tax=Faecalibacillus faecis TaxID=1982628 RepID=UPI0032BFF0ED